MPLCKLTKAYSFYFKFLIPKSNTHYRLFYVVLFQSVCTYDVRLWIFFAPKFQYFIFILLVSLPPSPLFITNPHNS